MRSLSGADLRSSGSPMTLRESVELAPFHYWRDYAAVAGSACRRAEIVWFSCGVPAPFFNRVVWTRSAADQIDDLIDETLATFAAAGRALRWHVNDDTTPADLAERLEARGFIRVGAGTPMALELAGLPASLELPAGVRIEQVRSLEQRARFGDILDAIFQPGEAARPFRSMELAFPESVYAERPRFLAFVDDEPAATSAMVEADGVAGIYAVGTLPAFRQRGLGALLTTLPLLAARERGVRYGILHASPMGEPVYRRIGFEPVGRQAVFQSPAQERG